MGVERGKEGESPAERSSVENLEDDGSFFSTLVESGVITDLPYALSSCSRLFYEYKCHATSPDGKTATYVVVVHFAVDATVLHKIFHLRFIRS